ncbi:MAG: MBL fold metallo-hydrolase, partial [Stackebrandtia sp.]
GLLRVELRGRVTGPPASELLSADPQTAARAVGSVQRLLDERRKALRRAQRARRRANRPDAETRRAARYEQRIGELRGTRDRLEQQLSTVAEENRELRTTVDNLDGELAQLRRHLEVAYARLESARRERDDAQVSAPVPRATTTDMSVTVRVLGGGTEIGGSCVLVSGGGARLLVDAGTRPSGVDEESLAPAGVAELDREPPDAIVLTHAHNDHAGWAPALAAKHPGIPIIASMATCDLLGTMWADSAKVLARRADSGESWAGGPLPPFRQAEVDAAIAALSDLPLGRHRRVGAFDIELFRAGHIIGATGVVITAGERRVVVTGDVSPSGQLSVGGLDLPESARGADLMLLESTYAGSGKLPPRDAVVDQFVADADRILGRGGRVLVPTFALGRAQEIALICREHLPDVEVLVDGLARDLSHAYQRHAGPDGERMRIWNQRVRPVAPGRTRKEIADRRPCVVVATSGMLNGGPAVAWAREILAEPESGLMVVGYQDADSPGSRLLSLAEAGGGRFELPGPDEPVDVAAHVGQYRLGAHASEEDLVKIVAEAEPKTLMLVHGRLAAQRQFQRRLQLRRQHTVLADEPWTS